MMITLEQPKIGQVDVVDALLEVIVRTIFDTIRFFR